MQRIRPAETVTKMHITLPTTTNAPAAGSLTTTVKKFTSEHNFESLWHDVELLAVRSETAWLKLYMA